MAIFHENLSFILQKKNHYLSQFTLLDYGVKKQITGWNIKIEGEFSSSSRGVGKAKCFIPSAITRLISPSIKTLKFSVSGKSLKKY